MFYQIVTWLVIPTNLAFPCNFTVYKYVFIITFKTRTPYFKRTVRIILKHKKVRSGDNTPFYYVMNIT